MVAAAVEEVVAAASVATWIPRATGLSEDAGDAEVGEDEAEEEAGIIRINSSINTERGIGLADTVAGTFRSPSPHCSSVASHPLRGCFRSHVALPVHSPREHCFFPFLFFSKAYTENHCANSALGLNIFALSDPAGRGSGSTRTHMLELEIRAVLLKCICELSCVQGAYLAR